jgi:GT2 family glycosyltransferase
MRLLVSILNWNNSAATNECLAGIAAMSKDSQPDVLMIDNHSTREPLEIKASLKKSLRSLELFENETNLGFGGGHNKAIRYASEKGYDYIILLNNDSEIIDKEIFDKLVAAIGDNPKALAANPMILSSIKPEVVWYGGGRLSLKTGQASHLNVGAAAGRLSKDTQTVSLLTGGCLAINLKRADLETVMFPDDYFLYWEDTDWSARAAKAGFELLYVPRARLLHKVSSSLGTRSPAYIYYNVRNHFLFVRRNVPAMYRPVCWLGISFISLKYLFVIFVRYKSQRLSSLGAVFKAWLDGVRNIRGASRWA